MLQLNAMVVIYHEKRKFNMKKQKKGKKRMKQTRNVEIPQSAFLAILKSDNDNKVKIIISIIQRM